jgi:hypothetical protein
MDEKGIILVCSTLVWIVGVNNLFDRNLFKIVIK